MDDTSLTLRLPAAAKAELQRIADEEGRSIAETVRRKLAAIDVTDRLLSLTEVADEPELRRVLALPPADFFTYMVRRTAQRYWALQHAPAQGQIADALRIIEAEHQAEFERNIAARREHLEAEAIARHRAKLLADAVPEDWTNGRTTHGQ